MKSNKQAKVKVNQSGFKRSKFNWSHDVNTTFNWGEIQPTQCKMLIPGSKTTFQAQSLIRLAPMVAPTFGRVKYKTYNQFVSMAEIFPNWDAMMAQEPKSTSFGTQVPQEVPTVKLGILSAWVLQGARATLYFANPGTIEKQRQYAAEGRYIVSYRQKPTDGMTEEYAVRFNALQGGTNAVFAAVNDPWSSAQNGELPDVVRGLRVALSRFGANYGRIFGTQNVVLSNRELVNLEPVERQYDVDLQDGKEPLKEWEKEVTLEGADYVLEGEYNDQCFAVAFELSDLGKRIRKVLQGCGYQINFLSETRVSILPLLAQYKAYFDIFGLQLYQGWETTNAAKMIKYIENGFITDCDVMFTRNTTNINTITNENRGVAFMLNDIANMWYTDDADYVSAHLNKLAVSPAFAGSELNKFISVGYDDIEGLGNHLDSAIDSLRDVNSIWNSQKDGSSLSVDEVGDSETGGHARIKSVYHSELDSEMLKRLYRWTNRNTILGRRIAEILRAQGFGKYVDECKSYYIGSTDTLITISDVVSTADTTFLENGSGAVLGEYGGKGLQYSDERVLSFENDEYGYWITLAAIVPEAGYTQGLDTTITATRKLDFYQPDFDAMGMEATPKEFIVGNASICSDKGVYTPSETFGFIPRYSRFKVAQNLVNGDFNRHGLRSVYLPYTLDKQLNINDYDVESESYVTHGGLTVNFVHLNRSRQTGTMPIAGNVWRYPTKYAWLGNFNRIFYNIGQEKKGTDYGEGLVNEAQAVGWNYFNNDNFLGHSIYEMNCYAPMKPIVDSYGLEEDDSMRAGAEFTSKA